MEIGGCDGADRSLSGRSGLKWLKELELREPYCGLQEQDLRVLEVFRVRSNLPPRLLKKVLPRRIQG